MGRLAETQRVPWYALCFDFAAGIGWALEAGSWLSRLQKRAGARLRSRSSSGQADKIAVVFMLENSCDVPTTRPIYSPLTASRKKMQP
jgi:hypothetical protein